MRKILWFVIFFFACFYFLLIILHKIPPMWDEAWYLSTSVHLYRSLVLGNFFTFLKAFSHAFGGDKAPLISALPLPFYLIFGTSYISAMLVNVSLIVLLSLFTFKLVKYIEGNDYAALFSVIIINTMPLFHSFARQFMVEYGLGVLVLMSVYYLLKSDYFFNEKYVLYFGILLGLGLLMKILYPFFIVVPFLIIFVMAIKLKKINTKILFYRISQIMFLGIIIASSWYLFNLKFVLANAFHASFGKAVQMRNLSIDPFLYIKMFITDGISRYYACIFLAIIAIFLIKRRVLSWRFNRDVVILLWFLVPVLFLMFSSNKQIRYALPCFPPLAIILGICIFRIFKKKSFFILVPPVLFFIFNPFIQNSFAKILFNSPVIDNKSDWKIPQIIQSIAEHGKVNDFVLSTVDHEYFNNFTLDYYAKLKWLPQHFFNLNFLRNMNDALYVFNNANFIIVKTGYPGPDFCNKYSATLNEALINNKQFFYKITSYNLPDNSIVSIYKRIR